MIVETKYAFNPSETKSFCAVIKIIAPLKNGKADNYFLSPNDFAANCGKVEKLGNEEYWVAQEFVQGTSWEEVDQLVEQRVEEIRKYRKWALETMFSVPLPKRFVIV